MMVRFIAESREFFFFLLITVEKDDTLYTSESDLNRSGGLLIIQFHLYLRAIYIHFYIHLLFRMHHVAMSVM